MSWDLAFSIDQTEVEGYAGAINNASAPDDYCFNIIEMSPVISVLTAVQPWKSLGQVIQDYEQFIYNTLYNLGVKVAGSVGSDVVNPVWINRDTWDLQLITLQGIIPNWGNVLVSVVREVPKVIAIAAGADPFTGAAIIAIDNAVGKVVGLKSPSAATAGVGDAATKAQAAKAVVKTPDNTLNTGDFATPLIFGSIAYICYRVLFG